MEQRYTVGIQSRVIGRLPFPFPSPDPRIQVWDSDNFWQNLVRYDIRTFKVVKCVIMLQENISIVLQINDKTFYKTFMKPAIVPLFGN